MVPVRNQVRSRATVVSDDQPGQDDVEGAWGRWQRMVMILLLLEVQEAG